MGKNRSLPAAAMWRWDQYNKRWVQFTGSVNELGQTVISGAVTSGLSLDPYDYVARTVDSATETWTFKTGGSGGTTTNTVVIVYTDGTLETISTVTKT